MKKSYLSNLNKMNVVYINTITELFEAIKTRGADEIQCDAKIIEESLKVGPKFDERDDKSLEHYLVMKELLLKMKIDERGPLTKFLLSRNLEVGFMILNENGKFYATTVLMPKNESSVALVQQIKNIGGYPVIIDLEYV